MSNLLALTSSQLNQAAKLKDQISALEKQLTAILGGATTESKTSAVKSGPKKSKFSAAGLARIKAAQIARWAKINSGKPAAAKAAAKPVAQKKSGGMSPAGRARVAAAAKARWAKVKAAGKNTL